MLQARRQLDLGQKRIGAERLGDFGADDLDRDLPRVPNVLREVDGRHPAFAELALDVVAAGETAPEHVVGARPCAKTTPGGGGCQSVRGRPTLANARRRSHVVEAIRFVLDRVRTQ